MSEKSHPVGSDNRPLVWLQHHRGGLGLGFTMLMAGSAAVAYGVHERNRRLREKYIARGNIFEFDKAEAERSRRALLCQDVAAFCLTRTQGVMQPELQKAVRSRRNESVGDALHVLVRADMIEARPVEGTRARILLPHADLLGAIALSPDDWDPLLSRTQHFDQAFDLEQFLASIRQQEISNGNL